MSPTVPISERVPILKPRRPHQTPLYRLVQEHLETFLANSREACLDDDPIPEYVERTFRKYLECGIPAFGVARARCASCGYDFLVPFSCKTRGLCPSCNTRRMDVDAMLAWQHEGGFSLQWCTQISAETIGIDDRYPYKQPVPVLTCHIGIQRA